MMKKAISLVLLLVVMTSFALAASPVDVEMQAIDGSTYIVKTYELPPDSNPAVLLEDDFEQDGFLFSHHTTTCEDILTTDSKQVTETVTEESASGELSEVLKHYPATLAYEQDGYTGTLILDTNSIVTEVSEYTTKSSTISVTQECPNMMYQDASAVPQSTVKNGVTLPLTNISWTVTGTSLAGDSLVPTEYRATAIYSKTVYSKVPAGYVSTAIYSGEVSKSEVSTVRYTVTYIGTPIAVPEASPLPWFVLVRLLAVILLIVGSVLAVLAFRSRQGVQVYNLIEDNYLCIGRQQLDLDKPVIDLNEFDDMVQSKFFSFILDKATTRRLFGRTITVTLGDVSMPHQVRELKGPYRFNLEVGVDL